MPVLSIVICFRDWGLDRLSVCITSHMRHSGIVPLEVIVSDFGSKDAREVAEAVARAGGRVVRSETSGPWSRAACLNAGVAKARARNVVTTDADIVFSPACYTEVVRLLEINKNALYLVQCRDLDEEWDAQNVSDLLKTADRSASWWKQLDASSRIRPRWGMGGFAAFSKSAFAEINGYEERMQIWGGEDNDFAARFRRAGYPLRWLSRPDTRIYHIWHEPTQNKANATDEGRASVERNRAILSSDGSTLRNPRKKIDHESPPVTVIVPTYKRGVLLRECLSSIQRQTWRNFEAIIVENGDSNEAGPIIDSLNDSRFRYIKADGKGAALARNLGVIHARGRFIVVHDDDDLMVATRIEDHVTSMRPGSAGNYGGWIDFDHETKEVLEIHRGKAFSFPALLCNGKVLTHGALMLDRRIFRLFRYQEHLTAGIDYGFLLLLARNGMALSHTGKISILRRMHGSNMTRTESNRQKSSALSTIEAIKTEIGSHDYSRIRSEGLRAESLDCDNEETAIGELRRLTSSPTGARRLRFSTLEEVDDWIDQNNSIDTNGLGELATPGVAAIVRSRISLRRFRSTTS